MSRDAFATVRKQHLAIRDYVPWLDAGISMRAVNVLLQYGCKTPEQIRDVNLTELRRVPNAGNATISEIEEFRHMLRLSDEDRKALLRVRAEAAKLGFRLVRFLDEMND